MLSFKRLNLGVEIKLGAISALFVLLVAANVVLTEVTLTRGRADARVMNVAGRQRMLTQKITRDAFGLLRGEVDQSELHKSLTQFDETLAALLDGDRVLGIQPVTDEQSRARLEQGLGEWKQFRSHVDVLVQGAGYGPELRGILDQLQTLDGKLETAARSVETSRADVKTHLVALAAGLRGHAQKLGGELLAQLGTAVTAAVKPAAALAAFERALAELLGASRDPAVRAGLQALQKDWDTLRPRAQRAIEVAPRLRQNLAEVNARNEHLLETMNDAVSFLEAANVARLQRLQSYQQLSLFVAVLLLLGGLLATRLFIVRPVAQSAHSLAVSSAQILTASQELETEAQDQFDALKDVIETVQSLTESATRISQSAEGVRENAERSRQTTDLTVKRFEELSARTTRVAELLETIRHIAERSDLLALNASLEGSRAGEAGRAFSLVAKEIRRLAEAVGASVVDVKKLVADIRASGTDTVQATDEARKLAQSTAEASAEISMTTERQRNATLQLAESMQAISAVLSRSTSSTRQTRTAAADLKRQAERLNAVVSRVHGAGS